MKKFRLYPHQIFDSSEMAKDLGGKSVRGGIITMGSTGLMFIVTMTQTVVLARLLTPEDFGIIGMVTVIIGIVGLFKDAGLSTATIQNKEITPEQISTLFWINVFISIGAGLIILFCAPLISWFYDKPELTWITVALAFSFVLGGFSIQHNALLRRHMRFGLLTIKSVLSAVIGLIVSITLALNGFNYWALIAGTISLTVSEVVLTFFFCPWFPGKMVKGSGTRAMMRFGFHLTGYDLINYFSRNLDNILIGKFVGSDGLGLYSKAYALMMLPISHIRGPINQVALPALSQLQKEPIRFQNYFFKIIDLLATISFPIFVYLFFESGFVITIMLGPKWFGAIRVFKLLALAGILQIIVSQGGLILISLGKSKRYLIWGFFSAVITVTSFIVGIPYGIIGVATAYAIGQNLLFIPSLIYTTYNTPIKPLKLIKILILPLIISITAAIMMEAGKGFWKGDDLIYHLAYASIFILVFGGLTLLRGNFRKTLMMFVKVIVSKRIK